MLLDRRHRWGAAVAGPRPATRQRTCSACGRTDVFEVLIPDAVVATLFALERRPNPFRTLQGVSS